jgi:hypothetical protein
MMYHRIHMSARVPGPVPDAIQKSKLHGWLGHQACCRGNVQVQLASCIGSGVFLRIHSIHIRL